MHGTEKLGSRAAEFAELGRARLGAGDMENAAALLCAALDEDPDHADAVLHLGVVVAQKGHWRAATAAVRRVLAIRPDDVLAWNNLGLYLSHMQRFDEADKALARAIELDPDHAGVRHNIGLLRFHQNRAEEAVQELTRAIALFDQAKQPCLGARSDLSLSVMKAGRLHEGLELNEIRWQGALPKTPVWECSLPVWTGEPLAGKTLLLHSEQGYGDAIQFVRFVPQIKAQGGRVIFAVPGPLVRLLDGQCDCDEVIDMANLGALIGAARAADYHVPLLSAVYRIGAEFEGQPTRAEPYLRPVPSPTGRRTSRVAGAGFRVGLVWAASPGYQRSRERSIPVEDLLTLAEVPGVRLYSLQVGPYRADLARAGADGLVVDLADQIDDFADTVNLAAQLDLVVCVDTGPLHAIAASGTKTWLVQPISTCWRWARGARIWYGCCDEYYQERAGSWREPIEQMKADLERLMDKRTAL